MARAQSARYGEALLIADDFTGDGVPDLIVSDPDAADGKGLLFIFHGPVTIDPLPHPTAADRVVELQAEVLYATGFRLKQACDFTFDGIRDIYVAALVERADGSFDERTLVVEPVAFRVLMDARSGPDTPFYWDELGGECDFGNHLYNTFSGSGFNLGNDGGDSSSSSSSSSPFGFFELSQYALALWDINPITRAKNVAAFVEISVYAREIARQAYPVTLDMTPAERTEQRWRRNALRHAVWQARLTVRFGPETARAIGDAHEQNSDDALDSWIDQYNNQVARNIAVQCLIDGCTIEELIQRLLDAIEDGRFITNPCDPRVPADLRSPLECGGVIGPAPVGDVNSDGVVNEMDLVSAILEFGNDFRTADFNANGIVDSGDIFDLVELLSQQE